LHFDRYFYFPFPPIPSVFKAITLKAIIVDGISVKRLEHCHVRSHSMEADGSFWKLEKFVSVRPL
jgi:hypothetical protein